MTENNQLKQSPARKSRSLFWPIMLISVGMLLLLSNLGILPWTSWNLLWRFWPLILVAVGIDVLIGQRSTAGAVISAMILLALIGSAAGVVFFAEQIPLLEDLADTGEWQTSQIEHPMNGYQEAEIYIDWTSLPGELSAQTRGENLIEGEITYLGDLIFDVRDEGSRVEILLDTRTTNSFPTINSNPNREIWQVNLTPDIPLDLSLDSGSGSCDFDLSDLQLQELFIDSGSGSIRLDLPDDQSFPFFLDSGSGNVIISIPDEVGVRIELDGGSGSFNASNRFELVSGDRDDGVFETGNYDRADDRIELKIDQGSGSITIQ
jgi:hypothetical protein